MVLENKSTNRKIPDEQIEKNNRQKLKILEFVPALALFVSIISLMLSWNNSTDLQQRNEYLDKTNFNIIQNLWQDDPSYTLYNESQKPLTSPPHQSYYMYIPTTIQRNYSDGGKNEFLILLPVSYENIKTQVLTGKTIDEIETSTLPHNFYAKKGSRDLRETTLVVDNAQSGSKDKIKIRTYPFLVIATEIHYSYKDEPDDKKTEQFISTVVRDRIDLSQQEFKDLENYTRNIHSFKENEIVVKANENVYDSAHIYLVNEYKFFSNQSNYDEQHFINILILAGIDPNSPGLSKRLSNSADFSSLLSEPHHSNFNSIMYKLVHKYNVLPQDPLVPDY